MTSDVAIDTNRAEVRAIEAIEEHHAELLDALTARAGTLLTAAMDQDDAAFVVARDDLTGWCERELVPHAAADEQALYPHAGRLEAGRLLVEGMIEEHTTIRRLVAAIAAAEEPVVGAAAAVALRVVFQGHMNRENDLIVPLLAADEEISLSHLLDEMHERLSAATPATASTELPSSHHHSCGCNEADEEVPELDARLVPHAIRHATIFGALDAVRSGRGMVLVAPHDPLPLLAQIDQRDPGAFAVEYLQRGPEAWRLQFVRTG